MTPNAPHRPLQAKVTIRRAPDHFEASVQTELDKVRTLSGASCEAVLEATAVILALAIDPDADVRARRTRPTTPREPPAKRAELPRFFAGAGSSFDTATLPHLATGPTLEAGFSLRHWSAKLTGTYWLPASTSLAVDPNLGGSFSWWTIGVAGCFDAALALRARPGFCLSPELGRLQGTGTGADENRTANATWFALAATPSLAFRLSSRVVLRTTAGAALTILGWHSFILERSQEPHEVHRPARLSARASLALNLAF
ncbi:MAG: hypothetical protein ACOY0T_28170 [Myxococcota bacterium]